MAGKRILYFLLFVIGLIVILYLISGMTKIREPEFKIIEKFQEIEIREYSSMIIAETKVDGNRKEAIRKGFRRLADFVFGDNVDEERIGMTAPVLQQNIYKLQSWWIKFIMPCSYKIDQFPSPNNKDIKIKELPSKRYLIIRFPGTADDYDIKQNIKKLIAFAKEKSIETDEQPILAFYSPPWTLPFLKRNEIMLEVQK